MKRAKIIIKGWVRIIHFDKTGKILNIEEGKNMVVSSGKQYISKLINGISTQPFKFMAVGTDVTAEDPVQTTLIAEVTTPTNMARKEGTATYVADYQAKLSAIFTNNSGSPITLKEAGIFDTATTGGNMLARKTFADKVIAASEAIQIDWVITVG